uniref:Chemosensory protein 3 n=1 Tax=Aulacocentrum confusum TaxID=2767324 RepID=A0A7G8Z915_9HYME|nr:chemosensory protein 3 [Aulacocentrum confusum]
MKVISVLVLLAGLAIAAERPGENLNIDHVNYVLNNQRLLTNYIKCLLDERPCTGEVRELKKLLPELLKNGCNKCDTSKRAIAEKVVRHLQTKRKQEWATLLAKYDPKGEYQKRYNSAQAPHA